MAFYEIIGGRMPNGRQTVEARPGLRTFRIPRPALKLVLVDSLNDDAGDFQGPDSFAIDEFAEREFRFTTDKGSEFRVGAFVLYGMPEAEAAAEVRRRLCGALN